MSIPVEQECVWFITGASRGIGLEMSRQLLESPFNTVVAACRRPEKASALQTLASSAKGELYIVRLDVANSESIREGADVVTSILGDRGIDYLINNAGINPGMDDQAFSFNIDALEKAFRTNVIGPTYVAQSFLPLVEKGKKKTIVNISSTLGSMGTDLSPVYTSYAITKAALNMLTYKQAKERPDIIAVTICPGWLKTDMGTQSATHEVSVGVEGVLRVVSSLTFKDSGQYFNFKGDQVPW